MRKPSINILAEDLVIILEKYGYKINESDFNKILKDCFHKRLNNRLPTVSKTLKKKLVKESDRSNNQTGHFYSYWIQKMSAKHIPVRQLSKGQAGYVNIENAAAEAVKFCEAFGYPYNSGVKKFVDRCLTEMRTNVKITRFSGKILDTVYEKERTKNAVKTDDNREGTKTIFNHYLKLLALDKTNSGKFFKNQMYHFIYARQLADENEADYVDWIDAQIEGLAWTENPVEPNQLHTSKSIDRYNIFMINKKAKPSSGKTDFASLL